MALRLKVENRSIVALIFLMGIASFLLGLGQLGITMFKFSSSTFYGFFLLTAGVLLFFEKMKRRFKFDFESTLSLILAGFALILSMLFFFQKSLPATLQGVSGIIYILLGFAVIWELFE